jgi:hypothetical protein
MAKLIKLDNQTLNELLENLKLVAGQSGDWRAVLEDSIDTVEAWAEFTEEPERVVFRKFRHDGAVIALLPDQYNPRNGNIGSYMELGQHAETAPDFGDTVAADPSEYGPLLGELRRQGYSNLKVVKRLTIRKNQL